MIPPQELIRRIPPFSFLSEDELRILVSSLEVELVAKDRAIYRKGQVAEYVYIVFSGLVGLFDEDAVVDYLSRGEIFGVLCLNGFPSNFTAMAIEDSVCYLIAMDSFKKVFDNNERFAQFFSTFISKRFQSFRSIASDKKISEEGSYVLAIEKVIYKQPVVCGADTSIADAAAEMERKGVSSIVAVDDNYRAVGILTHKDLRGVIIRGRKSDPVSAFMSSPVLTVPARATIFDGFTRMIEAGVDHLVAVNGDDRVAGVITRKDIQVHLEPSFSIIKLYRKVAKTTSIAELQTIFNSLRLSVAKIAVGGPGFYDLSKMICSVHDAIVAKAVEIASAGNYSGQFAWVHMGSSGRKEEIIATDQDTALIWEAHAESAFADETSGFLASIGFPRCPGNYMASNPMWNQGLAVWIEYFRQWFENPIPDHVRYLSVFLDMRPIYGAKALFDELMKAVGPMAKKEAVELLAHDAVQLEPPLGMSGIYHLHKGVDLKTYGIYPIVNGVRALALDSDILGITNTRERLEALGERGVLAEDMYRGLVESYGFLQDLRLRHHARAVLGQTEANNIVHAREISRIDLLILKESLKVVAAFQKFLMKRYDVQRMVIYSQL
jgi:CBS domain-containing protein